MTSELCAPKQASAGRRDRRPRPRVAVTAAAAALLSVRNLHLVITGRRRQTTPILRGVSLSVAPGEVHGLVGESGAGKTMIGKVILGIQPSRARIVRGSVVFEGRDIIHLDERERRRLMGRGLGPIPQDPMASLNPAYRIGGQIAAVLRLHLGMNRAAAGGAVRRRQRGARCGRSRGGRHLPRCRRRRCQPGPRRGPQGGRETVRRVPAGIAPAKLMLSLLPNLG